MKKTIRITRISDLSVNDVNFLQQFENYLIASKKIERENSLVFNLLKNYSVEYSFEDEFLDYFIKKISRIKELSISVTECNNLDIIDLVNEKDDHIANVSFGEVVEVLNEKEITTIINTPPQIQTHKIGKLICPHCEGSNIKKKSVIYAEGVSSVSVSGSLNSSSIATHASNILYPTLSSTKGIASLEGVTQTLLASQCAPPLIIVNKICTDSTQKNIGNILMASSFVLPFIGLGGFFITLLITCILFFIGLLLRNSSYTENPDDIQANRDKYEVWSKEFVCLVCGTVFSPEEK